MICGECSAKWAAIELEQERERLTRLTPEEFALERDCDRARDAYMRDLIELDFKVADVNRRRGENAGQSRRDLVGGWRETVRERYALLRATLTPTQAVEALAKQYGKSERTIWRWLEDH